MSGSLGKIIQQNTLHLKNIGSYSNQLSDKSFEEYNQKPTCTEFQQYNDEHGNERETQILMNKYKSNITYLQSQIKQILKLNNFVSLIQQQKQIKATYSQLQSYVRKLKFSIKQRKYNESKLKENNRKVKDLQNQINSYKVLSDELIIKQKQIDSKLNELHKLPLIEQKQQGAKKFESILLGYQNKIESSYKKISSSEYEADGEETQKQSRITNQQYENQLDNLQYSSIIQQNTQSQQSYYNVSRKQLGEKQKLNMHCKKPYSRHCSDKQNLLKTFYPSPHTQKQLSYSQLQYKNLLQQRIKLLKQGIKCARKQTNNKIQNMFQQKICIKKNIQLFKLSMLKIENQNRKIYKMLIKKSLSKERPFSTRFNMTNRFSSTQKQLNLQFSSPRNSKIYNVKRSPLLNTQRSLSLRNLQNSLSSKKLQPRINTYQNKKSQRNSSPTTTTDGVLSSKVRQQYFSIYY